MLDQHRSTQRKVSGAADDEAALTGAIVELARQYGRYGYRRVTALLRAEGWRINRKREPTPNFRCGPELTRFVALVGGVCADVGERGLIRGA